jgi:hypothetical protein
MQLAELGGLVERLLNYLEHSRVYVAIHSRLIRSHRAYVQYIDEALLGTGGSIGETDHDVGEHRLELRLSFWSLSDLKKF